VCFKVVVGWFVLHVEREKKKKREQQHKKQKDKLNMPRTITQKENQSSFLALLLLLWLSRHWRRRFEIVKYLHSLNVIPIR